MLLIESERAVLNENTCRNMTEFWHFIGRHVLMLLCIGLIIICVGHNTSYF